MNDTSPKMLQSMVQAQTVRSEKWALEGWMEYQRKKTQIGLGQVHREEAAKQEIEGYQVGATQIAFKMSTILGEPGEDGSDGAKGKDGRRLGTPNLRGPPGPRGKMGVLPNFDWDFEFFQDYPVLKAEKQMEFQEVWEQWVRWAGLVEMGRMPQVVDLGR